MRALAGGLADQTHTAEFTRNEDAGYVGLEMRIDLRDVHAAPFGAEHQRDRIVRTSCRTGAVADAHGRVDQHRLAFDHADRAFRAGLDAAP